MPFTFEDALPALAGQLRDRGMLPPVLASPLGDSPEWEDESVPGESRVYSFLSRRADGVRDLRTDDEINAYQAQVLGEASRRFGVAPEQVGQVWELQKLKAIARRDIPDLSTWQKTLRGRLGPGSTVAGLITGNRYKEATERYVRNEATADDLKEIALEERYREIEEGRGTGEAVKEAVYGLPAFAAEFVTGAKLATGAAGLAAKAGLGGASRAMAGGGVLANAVRGAAATPLVPSSYIPLAQQNAEESGGEFYDPSNLAPAAVLAAVQNAVVGATQARIRVPGGAVPRAAAKAGAAMVEQQVADTGLTLFDKAVRAATDKTLGLDTGYGVVGSFVREDDTAWKRLAVQAATFAAFSGIGEAGGDKSGRVLSGLRDSLNAYKAKGWSRERAAEQLVAVGEQAQQRATGEPIPPKPPGTPDPWSFTAGEEVLLPDGRVGTVRATTKIRLRVGNEWREQSGYKVKVGDEIDPTWYSASQLGKKGVGPAKDYRDAVIEAADETIRQVREPEPLPSARTVTPKSEEKLAQDPTADKAAEAAADRPVVEAGRDFYDPDRTAVGYNLMVGGRPVGRIEFGEPTRIGQGGMAEADAADRMFPGRVKPGETVSRIRGVEMLPEARGKGHGQRLYLSAMLQDGSDWFYNSQTSADATNVYRALEGKGLIEVAWDRMRGVKKGEPPPWGEPGGVHLVRLTDKGKQEAAKWVRVAPEQAVPEPAPPQIAQEAPPSPAPVRPPVVPPDVAGRSASPFVATDGPLPEAAVADPAAVQRYVAEAMAGVERIRAKGWYETPLHYANARMIQYPPEVRQAASAILSEMAPPQVATAEQVAKWSKWYKKNPSARKLHTALREDKGLQQGVAADIEYRLTRPKGEPAKPAKPPEVPAAPEIVPPAAPEPIRRPVALPESIYESQPPPVETSRPPTDFSPEGVVEPAELVRRPSKGKPVDPAVLAKMRAKATGGVAKPPAEASGRTVDQMIESAIAARSARKAEGEALAAQSLTRRDPASELAALRTAQGDPIRADEQLVWDALRANWSKLKPEHIDIFERRLNGETLEGIAATRKVSKEAVQQMEDRALKRIGLQSGDVMRVFKARELDRAYRTALDTAAFFAEMSPEELAGRKVTKASALLASQANFEAAVDGFKEVIAGFKLTDEIKEKVVEAFGKVNRGEPSGKKLEAVLAEVRELFAGLVSEPRKGAGGEVPVAPGEAVGEGQPARPAPEAVRPAPAEGRLTEPTVRADSNPRAGRGTVISAVGERPIPARYEVRELADIVASHDPARNFAKSEGYPDQLQPRPYHSDKNEQGKVLSGALKLNADRLLSDIDTATDGPPTITDAGSVVINGNGRAMMLKRAASVGKYEGYRKALAAKAEQFGIDPAALKGMERPVLVRVVGMDPASPEAARFARAGNVSQTFRQSPIDTAASLSSLVDADLIAALKLDGDTTFSEVVSGSAGKDFRNYLWKELPDEVRADYFTPDRGLTDAGKELVRDMLLIRAGVKPDTLRNMAADLKAVKNTLEGAIPDLLRIRRDGGPDLIPPLVEALDAWMSSADAMAMRSPRDVADRMDQLTLTGGRGLEVSPAGRMMLELLLVDGKKPKVFRQRLKAASEGEAAAVGNLMAAAGLEPTAKMSPEERIAANLGVKFRPGAKFPKATVRADSNPTALDLLAEQQARNIGNTQHRSTAMEANFGDPAAPAARPQPDRLRRAVDAVKNEWAKFAGRQAPATSRLNEAAGDGIARYASADLHAKLLAPDLIDRVMGTGTFGTRYFSRIRLGGVLTEMSLRYTRDAFIKLAQRWEVRAAAEKGKRRQAAKRKAREFARAAKGVKSIVGQVKPGDDPFGPEVAFLSEDAYQSALADPEIQAAIERYRKEVVPIMNENYRQGLDLNEGDPIESATQMPDLPVNLLRWDEGDPITEGVVRFGSQPGRGNLRAPKASKSRFTKHRTGAAPGYNIDIAAMIENSIRGSEKVARKHDMYRRLIDAGLAVRDVPGATHTFGGEKAMRFDDVWRAKDSALYVDPRVYDEVRQALGTDQKGHLPLVTPVLDALNTANMIGSLGEVTAHTKNLLTFQLKPGVLPVVDTVRDAYRVLSGDPTARRELIDLADIGAMKDKGPETTPFRFLPEKYRPPEKLTPQYWTGKFLDLIDKSSRLTANRAFDRLVKRGTWGVTETEANRRDFVNQLGNYNRRTQSKLVAFLRDSGIGPFATAGTNYWVQGLRSLTGTPGAEARTVKGAIAMRAEMLGKTAAVLSIVPVLNYLLWGRVDGDDEAPVGSVKLRDENGKVEYFPVADLTGATRGAREIGLLALAEGLRERKSAGEIADKASHDIFHQALHPVAGPGVGFAYTANTGKNTLGYQVARKKSTAETPAGIGRARAKGMSGKDASQQWLNLQAAMWNLNSTVAALTGMDRPEEKSPTLYRRVMRALGAYGTKERKAR